MDSHVGPFSRAGGIREVRVEGCTKASRARGPLRGHADPYQRCTSSSFSLPPLRGSNSKQMNEPAHKPRTKAEGPVDQTFSAQQTRYKRSWSISGRAKPVTWGHSGLPKCPITGETVFM